jgi:hypothetical protein
LDRGPKHDDDQELDAYGQSQRWNPGSVNSYFAFAFMEETDKHRFGSYSSDGYYDLDNLRDPVPDAGAPRIVRCEDEEL